MLVAREMLRKELTSIMQGDQILHRKVSHEY